MMRTGENVMLRGAQLFAKNFSGQKFKDGKRTVGIKIPVDLAEELEREGWPIVWLDPYQDDPNGVVSAGVYAKVRFDKVPPFIVLVDRHGKTKMTEETIGQLDWTRIANCDVTLHPSSYPASNLRPAGISVYVKTMYVTIQEDDEFYDNYANLEWRSNVND